MNMRSYIEGYRQAGTEEKRDILRKLFGSAMSQSQEEK